MAYADQQMSSNRIIALIIVALIHIALGYVLITGLAYEAVKKAVERVTTVDIDEPEPEPEEEPPPPPEDIPDVAPPPPVAPPPQVNLSRPAEFETRPDPPKIEQPVNRLPPPPAPPPAPPPPRFTPKGASPRNNPGGWITTSDYRSSWINRGYAGTVAFRVQVGANGKVSSCTVTGGNAPQVLKDASCKLIRRRARFRAATDGNGEKTTDTYTQTVRWQIPD